MNITQTTVTIAAAATAAQALPYPVAKIISGYSMGALGTAGNTATAFSAIQTTTPSGSEVEFAGTPNVPATALTLGTAAVVDQILSFNVVRPGDMPAYL